MFNPKLIKYWVLVWEEYEGVWLSLVFREGANILVGFAMTLKVEILILSISYISQFVVIEVLLSPLEIRFAVIEVINVSWGKNIISSGSFNWEYFMSFWFQSSWVYFYDILYRQNIQMGRSRDGYIQNIYRCRYGKLERKVGDI